MRCERGQATIEWVGLVLLATLLLTGAAAAAGPEVDGRSFGGFLTHRLVCSMRGGCDDGHAGLAKQYGQSDAELLRRHAPDIVYEPGERELPVDYRECREVECSRAPDDRDLDAHRAGRRGRATVFTRVIRRNGQIYLQYWFYYPDSNTALLSSDKLWKIWVVGRLARLAAKGTTGYPGYHRDDWETYQVRIDRRGKAASRSSSHAHYQYCKHARCHNRWGPSTGWTRVSRGSHAGHIPVDDAGARRLPGRHLRERTSTSEGLRLIPLESIDPRSYRRQRNSRNLPWHRDEGVKPPWRKRVYRAPESGES